MKVNRRNDEGRAHDPKAIPIVSEGKFLVNVYVPSVLYRNAIKRRFVHL